MGRLTVLIAAAGLAAAATGCGGQQRSPDLFEVRRTGTIPGANLTLVVNDEGTATCNTSPPVRIPDARLIEARSLAESLAADISKPVAEVPKVNPIYTYRVTMGAGSATWTDGSLGLPDSFYRLALLTRQIAKNSCGLAR